MMFDKRTKNMICNGWKIETRRKYNKNRRPAVPGTIHKIKIDRTKTTYGEILITECYPQKFGNITEAEAHYEGFDDLHEYKKYFFSKNGFVADDELVWVVRFRVKWCSRIGIEFKLL